MPQSQEHAERTLATEIQVGDYVYGKGTVTEIQDRGEKLFLICDDVNYTAEKTAKILCVRSAISQ